VGVIVAGGKERQDSLKNGLDAIKKDTGKKAPAKLKKTSSSCITPPSLVSPEEITAIIDAAKKHGAPLSEARSTTQSRNSKTAALTHARPRKTGRDADPQAAEHSLLAHA